MADSLLPSCAHKFGTALALDQCFHLLAELFQMEDRLGGNRTLERCPEEVDEQWGPAIVHNRQHFLGPCTQMELFCLRYIFPLLQILSLAGNVFNLLIYRLPYFGGSSAVHFLRMKALANCLFVQTRLLESLHAWLPLNAHFEWLYWHSRPWLITLGNFNGTVATWLTLLVCAETAICILWPFSLRRLFSSRCILICLSACLGLAATIHSLFLLTHEVVPDPSSLLAGPDGANCFRIAISFRMRPSRWAPWLERPYYWMQMSLTIVLPTLAMLLCSALIVSRFTLKPQLGLAFSQRRKCVIRLTVATAASHLLLEGPSTVCYVLFAIRGADVKAQAGWVCVLLAANNVLSALNATIPFFLFLLCSSQFRQMSCVYIHQQWRGGQAQEAKVSADMLSQGMASLRTTPTPRENGNGQAAGGGGRPSLSSSAVNSGGGGQHLLVELEERRRLLSVTSGTAAMVSSRKGGGGVTAVGEEQLRNSQI